MALSGGIFPIHHGPSDGEAMSSWLTRLAIGHHLTPSIFFRVAIRSQKDIFKQDIDIKCPQSVLEEISAFTGKSLSVVEQTTFMPLQDRSVLELADWALAKLLAVVLRRKLCAFIPEPAMSKILPSAITHPTQ